MRHNHQGFTLIELLVVVAVIGVLTAVSLPAIQVTRQVARNATCVNNLHQIGVAEHRFLERHGRFPLQKEIGAHSYRMSPGKKSPGDKSAKPEKYGIEAVFVREGYVPANAGMWVCPSQPEYMQEYGNTYAFNRNDAEARITTVDRTNLRDRLMVWDNFNFKPGLSGVGGPFTSGYTIPVNERVIPHVLGDGPGYNALYADAHVDRHVP